MSGLVKKTALMVIGTVLIFALSGCMEGQKHQGDKTAEKKTAATKQAPKAKSVTAARNGKGQSKGRPERSIAIEAYLTEVSMGALYRMGVSRLPSGGTDNVTAEALARCIADPNNGKVISFAKLVAKEREETQTNSQNKIYVKSGTHYTGYDNGSKLNAKAAIKGDKQIGLEMSFEYIGFDENRADEATPPKTSTYNFKDILVVKDGQEAVVGGVQNGEKGLYLVVRATVMK